jgi:ABC-2 type transport system permease protein
MYSYVRKEIVQIIRRPGAFFSLILGPFLIMALFGVGYSGVRRPLDTIIVIPQGVNLARDAQQYQELAGPALNIVEVGSDREAARQRLIAQQVDLVLTAPTDAEQRLRAGREATQAEIGVDYNFTDPTLRAYTDFLAYRLVQEVNTQIIQSAVREGESYAVGQIGSNQYTEIPPEVIAQPTRPVTTNVAPSSPSVVAFFAPAVLALILQHMAVTLTALSLVRERLSGTMELFRISPVGPMEILVGKYIGFGLISAIIAVVTTGLLVGLLGVPLLSGLGPFVLVISLLVLSSLGLGLLISVVADSERQAVQLSLLVLLGSVFFSGFVLPVQEFQPAVQGVAYALPVTHGIRLLQDLMLRGATNATWQLIVLAVISLVLFLLTAVLLRRSMSRV